MKFLKVTFTEGIDTHLGTYSDIGVSKSAVRAFRWRTRIRLNVAAYDTLPSDIMGYLGDP